MRGLAFVLLLLSLVVGGARLFTGVVYLSDEPTAVLVLKRGPAAWIERPEVRGEPSPSSIVLDRDEPDLAYGRLYRSLMRMAPALAPGLAGAAAILLVVSRRQRVRRRD
jgi:hypothetical protein